MLEVELLELAEPLWAASAAVLKPSAWLPQSWRETINAIRYDKGILSLPDRTYLAGSIIPALAQRGARKVLFVGTRSYTRHYPDLFATHGLTLWTTDIDPFAERYGAAGRHKTIDATQLSPETFGVDFDAVIFSGVIGFGVDSDVQISRAASALGGLLRPGSLLVLGWNTDRSPDPLKNTVWKDRFHRVRDAGLSERVTFEGVSHVFDFLELRRGN